jgi:transposase
MQTQSKQLDFTGENIYAGIDVHLRSWKVTLLTDELFLKTYSQPPEPEKLVSYLKRNYPGANYYAGYESGFSGFWAQKELERLGVETVIMNAADIPTTHKEKVQREDKRDSRKIARTLKSKDYEKVHIPSDTTLHDRMLVRMRGTLVKDLSRNKNRIKSLLHFHGVKIPESFIGKSYWSRIWITWLESLRFDNESGDFTMKLILEHVEEQRKRLLKVNRKIRALSKMERYHKLARLLQGISGIGIISAMVILTELEIIDRFKNLDKLCAYIGIIPSTDSSGENDIEGDMTPRGHSNLRRTIIESAWTAARTDPALTMKYNQLIRRMEANKAIVRIAKKLLNRIRYVLKNQAEYVKGTIS